MKRTDNLATPRGLRHGNRTTIRKSYLPADYVPPSIRIIDVGASEDLEKAEDYGVKG